MDKYRNVEEALQAIDDDAAAKAWLYLQRETPKTAKAIQFLIFDAMWEEEKTLEYFKETYGPTEEKTMHKVKLIIESLIKERDS